jgi:hypothetical protein
LPFIELIFRCFAQKFIQFRFFKHASVLLVVLDFLRTVFSKWHVLSAMDTLFLLPHRWIILYLNFILMVFIDLTLHRSKFLKNCFVIFIQLADIVSFMRDTIYRAARNSEHMLGAQSIEHAIHFDIQVYGKTAYRNHYLFLSNIQK